MKKRNSRIELLKIIGIVLIVFTHLLPKVRNNLVLSTSYGYYMSSGGLNLDFSYFCFADFFGPIGNYLFIIPTCYYLCDSNKINLKRILNILITTMIVSILFGLIFMPFIKYTTKDILYIFTPFCIYDYWFIFAYVILYFVHSILNKFLNLLNKKQYLILLMLCFVFIILFYFISIVYDFSIHRMFSFIICYILIFFYKKNGSFLAIGKSNKIDYVFFITCFMIIIIYCIIAPLMPKCFSEKNVFFSIASMYNPIVIIMCLSIFSININKEPFYNDTINYLSSLTILIYLLHTNYVYYTYYRNYEFEILKNIFGFYSMTLFSILLAILNIVICTILAHILNITIEKRIIKVISQK